MSLNSEEILNDPEASVEELRFTALASPVRTLHHPNCPIDLWYALAREHPIEAMDSISFPLVVLEDPTRWSVFCQQYVQSWIRKGYEQFEKLDGTLKYKWAADCLEHVLPLLESAPFDDLGRYLRDPYEVISLPRKVVEAMRQVAVSWHGNSVNALIAAQQRVGQVWVQQHMNSAPGNVLRAAASHGMYEAARYAAQAGHAATRDFSEFLWQWERMVEYLRQSA